MPCSTLHYLNSVALSANVLRISLRRLEALFVSLLRDATCGRRGHFTDDSHVAMATNVDLRRRRLRLAFSQHGCVLRRDGARTSRVHLGPLWLRGRAGEHCHVVCRAAKHDAAVASS